MGVFLGSLLRVKLHYSRFSVNRTHVNQIFAISRTLIQVPVVIGKMQLVPVGCGHRENAENAIIAGTRYNQNHICWILEVLVIDSLLYSNRIFEQNLHSNKSQNISRLWHTPFNENPPLIFSVDSIHIMRACSHLWPDARMYPSHEMVEKAVLLV